MGFEKTIRFKDTPLFSQVVDDLTSFIHRVANNENATPAEIAALPEVAKILLVEPD